MDDEEKSNVVTHMNRPYVDMIDNLEGPDSRFGGELPEVDLGQIESDFDEYNVWSHHVMTEEDLFTSCVSHHGVDPNDDLMIFDDLPPHEISHGLVLEPPCETLEPWEPIECPETHSTNLNLDWVPHLSREVHVTEPPWHTEEKERPHFVAHSWYLPHYTTQNPPKSPFYKTVHRSPPPKVSSYVDFQIINYKKRRK
jgi:hypothetical protein